MYRALLKCIFTEQNPYIIFRCDRGFGPPERYRACASKPTTPVDDTGELLALLPYAVAKVIIGITITDSFKLHSKTLITGLIKEKCIYF